MGLQLGGNSGTQVLSAWLADLSPPTKKASFKLDSQMRSAGLSCLRNGELEVVSQLRPVHVLL